MLRNKNKSIKENVFYYVFLKTYWLALIYIYIYRLLTYLRTCVINIHIIHIIIHIIIEKILHRNSLLHISRVWIKKKNKKNQRLKLNTLVFNYIYILLYLITITIKYTLSLWVIHKVDIDQRVIREHLMFYWCISCNFK